MPTTRHVIALFAPRSFAAAACKAGAPAKPQTNGAVFHADDRIPPAASSRPPTRSALLAGQARPGRWCQPVQRDELRRLSRRRCRRMGRAQPGRWPLAYGGADDEIFTSIFYGRPKGMPAYGGVIGTDGVWMLVAYIKAQAVPTVVPTTSWLPGGNASATPPPAPRLRPRRQRGRAATRASVAPDQMPAKYGCTACHAVDTRLSARLPGRRRKYQARM